MMYDKEFSEFLFHACLYNALPDDSFFLNYLTLEFAFNRNFIFIYLTRFTSSSSSSHAIHFIFFITRNKAKYAENTHHTFHKYQKERRWGIFLYGWCAHVISFLRVVCVFYYLYIGTTRDSLSHFIIYFRVIYTITWVDVRHRS